MPGGRPPKIDQVIDRRPDGTEVTASQKVIDLTRTIWRPRKAIAAAASVDLATIDNWIKAGGLARARAARGEKLTPRERRYAEFLGDYEKAEGEAVAARIGGIQRVGQGGYTRRRTVTKTRQAVVKGEVVTLSETTVTEEQADGEWTALAWQLERGLPAEFGRRMELVGRDGTDLVPREQRAATLAEQLEAFQAGLDAQRSRDAEGAEPPAGG